MAFEGVANLANVTNIGVLNVTDTLVTEVGKIGLWIQAIGLVIILWIIFQIISLIYARKRKKKLEAVENKLLEIENKLDKLLGEALRSKLWSIKKD